MNTLRISILVSYLTLRHVKLNNGHICNITIYSKLGSIPTLINKHVMNQEETFNIIFKKLQNPFKFSYKMLKFEYLKECVTNLECVFLFSKLYALKKNLWKKI